MMDKLSQPGRLVDQDAMTILSSFLEATEHLPADISRGLDLIDSLHADYHESITAAETTRGADRRHALDRGLFVQLNAVCESKRLFQLVDNQVRFVSTHVKSLKLLAPSITPSSPHQLRPSRMFIPSSTKHFTQQQQQQQQSPPGGPVSPNGLYAAIYPSDQVPVISDDEKEPTPPGPPQKRILRQRPPLASPPPPPEKKLKTVTKPPPRSKPKPPPPPEPVYCTCHDVAYGRMVACDNPNCKGGEWFHYKCVGLKHTPKGKWLCPSCRKNKKKKK